MGIVKTTVLSKDMFTELPLAISVYTGIPFRRISIPGVFSESANVGIMVGARVFPTSVMVHKCVPTRLLPRYHDGGEVLDVNNI
jgi:hypothetical protein